MPQAARERTVEQLRAGTLDILVATDVRPGAWMWTASAMS